MTFCTVCFNDLEVEEIITQVDIKPWRILWEENILGGYRANFPSINGRKRCQCSCRIGGERLAAMLDTGANPCVIDTVPRKELYSLKR